MGSQLAVAQGVDLKEYFLSSESDDIGRSDGASVTGWFRSKKNMCALISHQLSGFSSASMVNQCLIAATSGGYSLRARGRRDGKARMTNTWCETRQLDGLTAMSAPSFGLRTSLKDQDTDALTLGGAAIGAGA